MKAMIEEADTMLQIAADNIEGKSLSIHTLLCVCQACHAHE